MRLTRILPCAALAAAIVCPSAWAQNERPERGRRPDRMPQVSAEQAESAWQWQAKSVARELQLGVDQADQLVEAYVAARKRLTEKAREIREQNRGRGAGRGEGRGRPDADGERGSGRGLPEAGDRSPRRGPPEAGERGQGGGRGGQGAGQRQRGAGPGRDIARAERAALESSCAAFMSEEQAKKATATLGTFNRQWDTMVNAVVGFELGTEKTYEALAPIQKYVDETVKLRASGDRDTMRKGMGDARKQLAADLGNVLNDEQMAEFKEITTRRRGRGGRGGQGAGRRPRADAGGAAGGATVGAAAPAFTLKDGAGKAHALADYKGRIVVLQWINPDCPFCRRVTSSGKLAKTKKQIARIAPDAVYLAINSTHYMESGAGAEYFKTHEIDAPVLVDRDGTVGHLYGAKTSPHVYVIDAEGVLRYQGAFDNDAYGSKGKGATNYVVGAVKQIAAGDTVTPDSTTPWGCSVKYKK